MFDIGEFTKRIIKYIIEGIMVAIVAYAIPNAKRGLDIEEIITIAITAAATFSILDTFLPSIAVSTRGGVGFGIGANLVGFPGGI
jgi:ABC-type Co2+ transport system permease subunit